MQPVRRFGMDGAIIFSDILVVPHALGMDVQFKEGEGPLLVPVRTQKELGRLDVSQLTAKLAPVYEALKKTKSAMPEETSLIGFVGAPWTLACYAVAGKSDQAFEGVKTIAREDRAFFSALIELFSEAVIRHAVNQVEAGAEIIQLFDSWAGVLNPQEYDDWVLTPAKKIIAAIKTAHPHVPVIGFPRMVGEKCEAYAKQAKPDAVSFDNSVSLGWVRDHLQPHCIVQGNLDNELLADDRDGMLKQAAEIVATLGHKTFVFNLGHGILPRTPIDNIQALCDFLKAQRH